MKQIFSLFKILISTIAVLVAIAGIALTLIGIYEFAVAVAHVGSADRNHFAGLIATGLLKSVDTFVMVVVFFVFALGVLILFHDPSRPFPINLPDWLHIRTFIQLKIVLWESILTTLVVSYIAGLAEKRMDHITISLYDLILPGAILLISLSLYLIKGRDH